MDDNGKNMPDDYPSAQGKNTTTFIQLLHYHTKGQKKRWESCKVMMGD